MNSLSKKIAFISLATALSFALTYIEIPVFPQAPFLKLDFSFAIILITSYMIGCVGGEISLFCLCLLCLLKTTSLGTGELCNFILGNVFIILPTFIYKYKKGLKAVIITLICSSLLATAISLPLNRFLIFPIYKSLGFFPMEVEEIFGATFYFIIAFNLIKYFSDAIITVLLYKRLKKSLNKFL